MLFAETLAGIILILCGILVKQNPNLIAGYNAMSDIEKAKVDIKRLSSFMHNSLILIGVLSIIIVVVMTMFEVKGSYRFISTTSFIVIGILYMAISVSRFKK